MVNTMKSYVVTRGALLDRLADDPLTPTSPVILTNGAKHIPVTGLTFRAAPYAGSSPFAAMQWRVGEVAKPSLPGLIRAGLVLRDRTGLGKFAGDYFTPQVTVPADSVKIGHTYRLRLRMQDQTGRWSHWSQPVAFTAAPGTGADTLQQDLRVTELMYNPRDGSDAEFVELHNTSTSVTLELNGVKFTQGIDYSFPAGATLPASGYLLVVRTASDNNFASFRALYGLGVDTPIYGPFSGALDNNGEIVVLKTAAGGADIASFQFGDGRGWPLAADGPGHSLVPLELAVAGEPNGSLNYPGNWRASTFINGSPGRADPPPPAGIVLNELVAHTDFRGEEDSNDWIELFNPTGESVTLGSSWFLSDDPADLKKWEIPPSTVVPGRGWVAFDEVTGFHHPLTVGFGLSKDGEQLFLSFLPGTAADRVVDSVAFKAQENDWSLGRSPDGSGPWSALTPATRGLANARPPAHLVISELMFHPKPTAANPEDNAADEFIELYNPGLASAPLWNTNGAWRLDGGMNFSFPGNTALEAGHALLIVNFSPTNSVALAAFKSTYAVDPAVLVLGPYLGKLNNSSDRVALEKPQEGDLTNSAPAWV